MPDEALRALAEPPQLNDFWGALSVTNVSIAKSRTLQFQNCHFETLRFSGGITGGDPDLVVLISGTFLRPCPVVDALRAHSVKATSRFFVDVHD